MLNEYIRREDALCCLEMARHAAFVKTDRKLCAAYDEVANQIAALPAEKVTPVLEGKWIVHYTTVGNPYTECASCHTDFSFKTDKGTVAKLDMRGMLYCPHCGANMEGGIDDTSH